MIGRTNAIGSKNGEIHGAIISVTTDEETLFGKDCFLKKDSVVIETKRLKSTGSCSFIVQDPGDYEISSSDGEQEISEAVTVSNDNIVEKTALPIMLTLYIDGGTVLPVDDVLIWMKCGRVKGKNHTTVEEVIADTDTLFLLMSDENAMKYLERSTGFSDAICADEIAMTYLGQSPYVDSTVLNSDLWVEKILECVHIDKIFTSLIPSATGMSNSFGSFEGSYQTLYGGSNYPYESFVAGHCWNNASNSSCNWSPYWSGRGYEKGSGFLKFKGNNVIKPYAIRIENIAYGNASTEEPAFLSMLDEKMLKGFTLNLTSDNNNFVKKQEFALTGNFNSEYTAIAGSKYLCHTFIIKNPEPCTGFSFTDIDGYHDVACYTGKIYIYGRTV